MSGFGGAERRTMPRDYSKVTWRFWHGATGRMLKRKFPDAQRLALYLIGGCRDSHMTGLFMCTPEQMGAECGLFIDSKEAPSEAPHPLAPEGACQGAYAALAKLVECGFCQYDYETCHVWVVSAAREQIAPTLSVGDKRRLNVLSKLDELSADCPALVEAFKTQYCEAFNLDKSADAYGYKNSQQKAQPKGLSKGLPKGLVKPGEQENRRAGEQERENAREPERTTPPPATPPITGSLSAFGLLSGFNLTVCVSQDLNYGSGKAWDLARELHESYRSSAGSNMPWSSAKEALVRLVYWVDRLEERKGPTDELARKMVAHAASKDWQGDGKYKHSAKAIFGGWQNYEARLGDLFARVSAPKPKAERTSAWRDFDDGNGGKVWANKYKDGTWRSDCGRVWKGTKIGASDWEFEEVAA